MHERTEWLDGTIPVVSEENREIPVKHGTLDASVGEMACPIYLMWGRSNDNLVHSNSVKLLLPRTKISVESHLQ